MTAGSRSRECVCFICNESRNKRVCPRCVQSHIATTLGSCNWNDLNERRDQLNLQLEQHLSAKDASQSQQVKLTQLRDRLIEAQQAARRYQEQKLEVVAQAQGLRDEIARRQADDQNRHAQKALGDARLANGQMLVSEAQTKLRDVIAGPLSAETRERLGFLMEVLPLSTDQMQHHKSGRQNTGKSTTKDRRGQVSVMGLSLPVDSIIPSLSQQERCSTALGYVLLIIDQLSYILDAPLLTESGLRGSTSSLWPRQNFWSNKSNSRSGLLKLHFSDGGIETSSTGRSGTESKPRSTLDSLKQRLQWDTSFGSQAPPSATKNVSDLRQTQHFRAAIHQLYRNVGVIGSGHAAFVEQSSIFAALSDLCWQIAMRPRTDSSAPLSVMLTSTLGNRQLGHWQSVLAERSEEDADGWDMIQRPFQNAGMMLQQSESIVNMVMPPAPSDTEDIIKHWETANFPRARPQPHALSPYLRPQLPQNLSRHIANIPQLGQAYAAADKWLSKFRGS